MTLRSKAFFAAFLVTLVFILTSGLFLLVQHGKDTAAEISLRRLMSQTFAAIISDAERDAGRMVQILGQQLDAGAALPARALSESADQLDLDYVFVFDETGKPLWQYNSERLGDPAHLAPLMKSLHNQIKSVTKLKNGVAYFEQRPLYLLVNNVRESGHGLVAGFYLDALFSRLHQAYGFDARLPVELAAQQSHFHVKGEVKLPGLISAPVTVWIEDTSFEVSQFPTLLIVLVVVGVLLGAALWWIWRRNFIIRIQSLIDQAHDINNQQAYQNRIKIQGDDELTELVGHYNSVLSTLEYSYNLMVKSNLITTELMSKVQANTDPGSAGNDSVGQQEEDELKLSLDMVNRLSEAVEHNAMELYFQPVFVRGGDELNQVEALCRWFDEDRGLVPPVDFLALAEKSGQMAMLARQVIDKACGAIRVFHDKCATPLPVSVNLSLSQFVQPNLVAVIDEALQRHGVSPELLEFEIKEHTLSRDLDKSAGIIAKLHERGVGICIDDFGLSKFSLMYLQRLPISRIKLSRSFVDRLERSPKEAAFIDGIARFSKGLNIRVIAKGVQSAQQLYALEKIQDLDCQGFALARPLPMDQFVDWLQSRSRGA